MAEGLLLDPGSEEASDRPVVISTTEDPPGLHVADRIEHRTYRLQTPAPVDPVPLEEGPFPVNVDTAVSVQTSGLKLPYKESVYITDDTAAPVAHTFDSTVSCPAGQYCIELTTSVKLYLAVNGPVRVTHGSASTMIDFGRRTTVRVGACSPRRHPAGTVTTTDDLDDIRTAITTLSSALEVTTPERSYPFRRAHPPLIELGETVSVPDYLSEPDTGITIGIRESLDDLFVAAPLAFYLGADIVWGDRGIETRDGYQRSFDSGPDFATAVERALKQTFLLDCLTRTEGEYPVDLAERWRFEEQFSNRLDFETLYGQSIGERVSTYLEVPFEAVADLVPKWSVTTYVEPSVSNVTALPFLLDSLSVLRTTGPEPIETAVGETATTTGSISRSTEQVSEPTTLDNPLILPDDGSLTTAWLGEGLPIGSSKVLQSGFRNRLRREPVNRPIHIQVVCAESAMHDELDTVRAVYESRSDLPFEVAVETDVATDDLRRLLEAETDFFHYIGHVDDRGFRCRDGWLDASECSTVGADVFLLNSCRSHEQGEWLVRKGAISGLVTVSSLLNHWAAAIGRTLAQFLHYGFPLYAALNVIRETHSFGTAYSLLGDPLMLLAQPTTTFPECLELSSQSGGRVSAVHRSYPNHRAGLGTIICPPYETDDLHYLFGGPISNVTLSTDELEALLSTPMPLLDEGELRFTVEAENAEG